MLCRGYTLRLNRNRAAPRILPPSRPPTPPVSPPFGGNRAANLPHAFWSAVAALIIGGAKLEPWLDWRSSRNPPPDFEQEHAERTENGKGKAVLVQARRATRPVRRPVHRKLGSGGRPGEDGMPTRERFSPRQAYGGTKTPRQVTGRVVIAARVPPRCPRNTGENAATASAGLRRPWRLLLVQSICADVSGFNPLSSLRARRIHQSETIPSYGRNPFTRQQGHRIETGIPGGRLSRPHLVALQPGPFLF